MSCDFIVETDLGHDPDDFFALCHLITAGGLLRCLCITPGSPEQVAIAALLRQVTGQSFTIGVAKQNPKPEQTGVHARLIARRGFPATAPADGPGDDLALAAHAAYPDADFLIIGPATSLGRYLGASSLPVRRLTMQGGFLPYSLYAPSVRLPEFEGHDWLPTFNLNGDRAAGETIAGLVAAEKRFVGKNVCHTIVFDRPAAERLAPPRDAAGELYVEMMRLYLEGHDSKKFHDPTALVAHLHPEIGTWVRGRVVKRSGGWSSVLDPDGDFILADIDREQLWRHLLAWT